MEGAQGTSPPQRNGIFLLVRTGTVTLKKWPQRLEEEKEVIAVRATKGGESISFRFVPLECVGDAKSDKVAAAAAAQWRQQKHHEKVDRQLLYRERERGG